MLLVQWSLCFQIIPLTSPTSDCSLQLTSTLLNPNDLALDVKSNRCITKILELLRRTRFQRPIGLAQSNWSKINLQRSSYRSTFWLFSRFFEVNENELLEIWLSSTLANHLATFSSIIGWFEFLKSLLSELWLCIVFVWRFIFTIWEFSTAIIFNRWNAQNMESCLADKVRSRNQIIKM